MSAEDQPAAAACNNLKSLIYQPKTSTTGGATTTPEAGSCCSLRVLDQLLLPAQTVYVDVTNVTDAWNVIHKMQIRGAPLIAIVAVLGLAVDLSSHGPTQRDIEHMTEVHTADRLAAPLLAYIQGKMDYLATSRPTAVNLFNALQEVKAIVTKAAASSQHNTDSSTLPARDRMVAAVVHHAEFMLQRDEADCRAIGKFGAEAILLGIPDQQTKVTLMTICNTGSLATAAYGTALGVVRSVHAQGRLQHIVVLETRPYNQGSRLTAYECVQDQLPGATLICDSMAAYYMAKHDVAAIVVGADRVAANGDTANKIGTYSLAVAAPFTTLDLHIPHGDDICIEQRPAAELLETARAPPDIAVWNPSFDVTPARYITGGIVTEKGVIRLGADGTLDVTAFVARNSSSP
jgi:S-methyl-5-thioribose-1-phosphate isomerase